MTMTRHNFALKGKAMRYSFNDNEELFIFIQNEITENIPHIGAQYKDICLIVAEGASNVSSSRYITIEAYDKDDELLDTFKIRIADHPGRRADYSIILEPDELIDEDNEFIGVEIDKQTVRQEVFNALEDITVFLNSTNPQ